MWVVARGEMTRLSDDEDAVEDVGSELDGSKRWWWSGRGCWQCRQMPVVGVIEVDGSRNDLSLDEVGWMMVDVKQPPALAAGGDGDGDGSGRSDERRWTRVAVDGVAG